MSKTKRAAPETEVIAEEAPAPAKKAATVSEKAKFITIGGTKVKIDANGIPIPTAEAEALLPRLQKSESLTETEALHVIPYYLTHSKGKCGKGAAMWSSVGVNNVHDEDSRGRLVFKTEGTVFSVPTDPKDDDGNAAPDEKGTTVFKFAPKNIRPFVALNDIVTYLASLAPKQWYGDADLDLAKIRESYHKNIVWNGNEITMKCQTKGDQPCSFFKKVDGTNQFVEVKRETVEVNSQVKFQVTYLGTWLGKNSSSSMIRVKPRSSVAIVGHQAICDFGEGTQEVVNEKDVVALSAVAEVGGDI